MKLVIKGSVDYLSKVLKAIENIEVTDMKQEFNNLASEFKKILLTPVIGLKVAEPGPAIQMDTTRAEITLDTIKELVLAKSTAGKKEDIKALLKEFGVQRTPELKEHQFEHFFVKLQAI
jgi:hypothetical protein